MLTPPSGTSTFIQDDALRKRAREWALSFARAVISVPNNGERGLAGSAGDALLQMGAFYATGESIHEAAMHDALRIAANIAGSSIGVFSGTSGLRAVSQLATSFEPRYARLVLQCDSFIDARIPAAPIPPRVFWDYDVIEGWAGARLARCVDGPRERDRLSSLLEWLIADWDRWKCSHPKDDQKVPVNDLGLAHGVAGILSALVLTHKLLDDETSRNIRSSAYRLVSFASEAEDHAVWPNSSRPRPQAFYRSSWCYGTPGVASALYSVGEWLGDEKLKSSALDAQQRVARVACADLHIDELGICHGTIGNALCFASLAAQAKCSELAEAADALIAGTLDALDKNGGVAPWTDGANWQNRTNELVGTGGIALVLLTMTNAMPPDWMRLHGLTPI